MSLQTEVTSSNPTENSNEYQEEDYDEDNGRPYDDNYDENFIPVPRDMFELTPSVPQPVQPTTKSTVCVNKPKTKPIPTATSNKYAIFAGDEEEDEIETNDKVITNEVDTTEPGPSNNNNKIKPDNISDDEES